MLLSKCSGYRKAIFTKKLFSPRLYRIIQAQKMSIDVIPTRRKTAEIPSFTDYSYLNPSTNNHLKPQDYHMPNKDQSKILATIQSYELNSQFNSQIIIAKYSKENEDEEEYKFLNDKQRCQLVHYIATLKTPYISIIDTEISGFNTCTSILSGFKVVTENTKVQLSSALSSFGTSFYLSRLDGNLGLYLLMTESCLTGKELLLSGLATHYIHSSKLNELEKSLEGLKEFDKLSVNQVLDRFSKEHHDDSEVPFGGYRRTVIDSCFKYDTIDEILEALKSNGSAFALKVHHVISHNYHMASICLDDIRDARKSLGFSDYLIKNHKQDLLFLNGNDFSCLCHSYLLPFEKDVKKFIEDKLFFRGNEDVIQQHFVELFNGKYGVREKVKDIIERKTKKVQAGEISKLIWCD